MACACSGWRLTRPATFHVITRTIRDLLSAPAPTANTAFPPSAPLRGRRGAHEQGVRLAGTR